MNATSGKEVLESLNWRYATKVFDPDKAIAPDLWRALEQALILTPSSYNLQPYKFLDVTDPARRAELMRFSWNQRQVVDASHYVVFTARAAMTEAEVDRLMRRTSEIRGVSPEALRGYRRVVLSDIVQGPRSRAAFEWAARQAYIALGNLMTCAALMGVDTCPMEGFESTAYDRILGLETADYKTVVACALGYRAGTDKYAALPKVRYEAEDLIQRI